MIEEIKSASEKILQFLLEIKDIKDPNIDWDKFSDLLDQAYEPLKNDLKDIELEADYRGFLSAAVQRSINFITEYEFKSEYEELAKHFK